METGEVICVGSGTRARSKSSYCRNKAWYVFTKDNNWYPVIVKTDITKREAEHLEVQLIDIYKPLGNTHKTTLEARKLDTEAIDLSYYYDETSPTALRYKKHNGQNGKFKRVNGDVAGYKSKRYFTVNVGGYNRLVHRVVWYLCTGDDPGSEVVIDHIDGNSCNNKFSNLRKTTPSGNSRNRVQKLSNTGYRGVSLTGKSYCVGWCENFIPKHKLFSIVKYGDELALGLAIEYRHRMLLRQAEIGQGISERQTGRYKKPSVLLNVRESELLAMFECDLPSNNESGVIGVSRSKSGESASWLFSRTQQGVAYKRSFSILKYGEVLAKALTIEFANRFHGKEPRCVENYSMSDTNLMLNDETCAKNKSGIQGIRFMSSVKGCFVLSQRRYDDKNFSKRFYIKELGLLESIALAIRWRNSLAA